MLPGGDKTKEQLVHELVALRQRITELEALGRERKRAEERLEHLYNVLRAIRNVNQLITREKDRDKLLTDICDNLVKTRGYYNAWLVLLDESGELLTSAEAGLGEDFLPMVERVKRGEMTACGRKALLQSAVVVTEDPFSTCTDCPLANMYGGRGAMSIRLEHGVKVYGLLSVSVPIAYIKDEEEQLLFKEVSTDVAFALCNVELEKERKRAEEALRESEAKYRGLVSNVKLGVFRSTPEPAGRFLEVNPAMEEITGYSREELLQMKVTDLYVHPEERELILGEVASAAGKTTKELPLRKKDGTEMVISDTKVVVRDNAGKIIYFDGTMEDITERKRMEEEIRKVQERFSGIYNSSKDAIGFATLDGILLDVNDSFCQLTGYSKEELVSKKYQDITPKEYDEYEAKIIERVLRTGKPAEYEKEYIRGDGFRVPILLTTFVVKGGDGKPIGLAAIIKDITERKRAEEALQEREQNFRALAENSTDAITIFLPDLTIAYANRRAAEMTGYSSDELLHISMEDLAHPDNLNVVMKRHQKRVRGELLTQRHEGVIIRKDGEAVPVEITATTTVWKGQPASMVVFRDITERKLMEEREKELQQELNHSSRLAAIGELAAGVAHEINNPLTGILGFSQRLLRKDISEEVSRDLKRIHDEAQRAATVVEGLLTFARHREPKKESLDINHILQKALELRAYELRASNIELATDLAASLPETMVDFQQIEEVFLNIILNAEQTMTEANSGGKLSIKTQRWKDYIRVSFTDNGPGISAENLDKLFDPFFTTRGERGGTGLGLSTCHGIVAEHGGRIYAKSKLGKGATFFVELPVPAES